jgi:hypothetical protein
MEKIPSKKNSILEEEQIYPPRRKDILSKEQASSKDTLHHKDCVTIDMSFMSCDVNMTPRHSPLSDWSEYTNYVRNRGSHAIKQILPS